MDAPSAPADAAAELELSVVIPCLNEAETLGVCIEKAFEGIAAAGTPEAPLQAEVIVADNGSTDGSREIAEKLGARVVPVGERGYGAALMGGIEAARGRFVIMGDADDSYDFREVPRFVAKLREGFDLVQGCRLPSGGGTIEEGAMPWSHRWIGNPLFSFLVRRWFKAPIHDVYCGLRGFTRALYLRLEQQCTGMEFATEMIIKSSLRAERIAEIPITLHRDGRILREPHLRTVKDGWRTLRFFLLFSPRWLFLAPGLFAILLGLLGYALAWPGWVIGGVRFDAHTLLFASLAILCGTQAVWFALCAKTYAINEGLLPQDERLERFYGWATLERGVALAGVAIVAATGLLIAAIAQWSAVDFGDLDYAKTMRLVIPGATLFALGVQAGLSSFFISMLGLSRRRG
ncbi:MAG: glycosyltransferase family 2 protein [Planctomycetota bacterium]|jgi:glycosyltransferase involved in cell wall biosynthesis